MRNWLKALGIVVGSCIFVVFVMLTFVAVMFGLLTLMVNHSTIFVALAVVAFIIAMSWGVKKDLDELDIIEGEK